ncbi:hypothetical protein [Allomuricauda sp. CP2A]|jgi:hypothetical protein|uniref:hypothetical protein n=1 Tax=Allomuricauda sp. CP2A TaxID=1848189 RepID=UPI0008342E81|nr:hypothetical protein [Muricauda sp. CP2A]
MNKPTLLFLLIFLTLFKVKAQKCTVEEDPFTNQETVSYNYDYQTVFFQKKGNSIFFEILFNYWGERSKEFDEKTEIQIKLENGTKLTLKTIRKSLPKIEEQNSSTNLYGGFGSGIVISNAKKYTVYSFAFILTGEELKKLAESKIEVIRIPDTEALEFVDISVKRKRSRKKLKAVHKGANCIYEHL